MFRLGYSVSMLAGNSAEVSLYGEIIADMPEEWKWSAEDKSAADFKKAIDEVRKNGANSLLLRINSPGGVCTEAVAMRSILASAGFDEITVRIEGLCASAATVLATIPGAYVEIAEGSEYMIHNPWGMAIGNANEIERTVDRLRNIEEMTRTFYAMRTGADEEQIKEWMDNETWFTAKEAVECGFAAELLSAEPETAIAACVTSDVRATMRSIYRDVPEQIAVKELHVSNGDPDAGEPTEINEQEENPMELEGLTMDELRAGNPALVDQIRQDAVNAERERLSDIDALTIPGYEEMASEAKANGTSVIDFQKQIVAAMKQKGTDFLAARKEEVAPAQEVAGDAPVSGKSEEQEINELAKSIAEFASMYTGHETEMF